MPLRSLYSRSLAAWALWLVAGSPAFAQSVNFFMQGEVTETTCTPTLSGSGYDGTALTLEDAAFTALASATATAKESTLTFSLVNCAKSAAINNMWVHFSSGNVDAGRIVTSHSQVQFEIMDVTSGGTMGNQVHVGGSAGISPTPQQGTSAPFTGTIGSRNASKSYIVRYYAKQAVTQPGAVTAEAAYTVKYH